VKYKGQELQPLHRLIWVAIWAIPCFLLLIFSMALIYILVLIITLSNERAYGTMHSALDSIRQY